MIYGTLALIVCLEFWLRGRRTLMPIVAATLATSVLFFVLTKFADWLLGPTYPRTWDGLMT